jgi:hypothetical protein
MSPCRRNRSTIRCSWSSPALPTRLRCRFRFGRRGRFGGRLSGSTETKLLRQSRSPFRICRRNHGVIAGKVPPCAIQIDGQPVSGCNVPAEHLSFPPAIQAGNGIRRDRSPDRHGRRPLDDGFCRWLTEAGERLMNGGDQNRELVARNLVSAKICGDDFRGEFSIGRCSRRFVGHRGSPVGPTTYHTRQIEAVFEDSPCCP